MPQNNEVIRFVFYDSLEEFNEVPIKNSNYFYIVAEDDEKLLFLGNNPISGGVGLTPEQIAKLNAIKIDGDGNSALFNDGNYKPVNIINEVNW